jgi:hypothetical protein
MNLSFRATNVSEGLEILYKEPFLDRPASAVVGLPAEGLGHTDEQVAELCAQHVGQRFAPLFREGPGKLSHSDADFSLACMLAFYCGNDPAQIERIFGRSALALRPKWRNRPEYRRGTIVAAVAALKGTFYTPEEPVPPLPEKESLLESAAACIHGLIRYDNADVETAKLFDLIWMGVPIRCDGNQLRDWRWLSAQIAARGFEPPPLKSENWLKLIGPWYPQAEIRELPPEATERGKLFVILSYWLRRAQNLYREPMLDDRKDLLSYLPVKVLIAGKEFIAYQLRSFQTHLKNQRYEQPRGGHTVFARMLAKLGTFPSEDDLPVPGCAVPLRVWLMPLAALPREEEPAPYDPKPPC